MNDVLIVIIASIAATAAVFAAQRFAARRAAGTATVDRLRADGTATTAEVLDTYDTGQRIDTIYVMVRLQLRIAATADVPGFDHEAVVPISPVKLAEFTVGRTIKVRIDPVTREVAVDQPVC